MTYRALPLIIASLILFGCATSADDQRAELLTTKMCCTRITEISISNTLAIDAEIEITKNSPAFDFPAGRSYFLAFIVPEALRGRELLFRTFGGSPVIAQGVGGHTFFFPTLTYLDSARQVISTWQNEKPRGELYGWAGRGAFVSVLTIPTSAAYVVMHTSTHRLGELYIDLIESPGFTAIIGGTLVSSGSGKSPIRAFRAATGSLMISEPRK